MGHFFDELVIAYDEWDWRKRNKHNNTHVMNSFPRDLVEVGNHTYGYLCVLTANPISKLHIGHFCSIGQNVTFIVSSVHPIDYISTFPFKVYINHESSEEIPVSDMHIDDDVWIGANATIMPGVHIGQGAVIGAGAVVTKDVPPYAIVYGVPAEVHRYRFSEEIIEELLKIDYAKLTKNQIILHEKELYRKLETIDQIEWLLKL
ncbi:CatB-related O-acetyltransferase [Butyrivibrio fibrisolvens]|uniref:CatB-related O-acetyltransferase n=1 Tax=Butyrivibrio fibrisolvens TaxID=831 RepID=UPI0003B6B749|nr:CatB-related O-acetyltransferase [Butyrivibrio fibrisolvens]